MAASGGGKDGKGVASGGKEGGEAAGIKPADEVIYSGSYLHDKLEQDSIESVTGEKYEEHPPDHPSVVGHLVSQLFPGQGLERVAVPPHFLEPKSITIKMVDSFMHLSLIENLAFIEDPLERILTVTRWFVSGWHYRVNGVKKPFNPIIGETFACLWDCKDGSKFQYYAEQVSHRPPVVALYSENRDLHLCSNGQIHTRSKFVAPQTAQSILDGFADVHVLNRGEMYRVTFPTYNAHNLVFGTPRTEVGGESVVYCKKTGLRVDISFHQLGMFTSSSEQNRVTAKVTRISTGEELASIDGHWDADFTIKYKDGRKEEFLDVRKAEVAAKKSLPPEESGPWEARRLWKATADELMKRPQVDWDEVTRKKSVLEEGQRQVPCHKYDKGDPRYKPWDTKNFHLKDAVNPITGEAEQIWTFDYMRLHPKKDKDEPTLNLIALSRHTGDTRSKPEDIPKPEL